MHLRTIALAILLLAGCGRNSDTGPPNMGSDPTNSTGFVAGTSDSTSKSDGQLKKDLSDEGEIRIAACEYILTHQFRYLTNRAVFILLPTNEMQVLASRLSGFQLRSAEQVVSRRDRLPRSETEDRKFVIGLSGIERNQNEATVIVGAGSPFGGGVGYPCHLKKGSAWTVERVDPSEDYDSFGPSQ